MLTSVNITDLRLNNFVDTGCKSRITPKPAEISPDCFIPKQSERFSGTIESKSKSFFQKIMLWAAMALTSVPIMQTGMIRTKHAFADSIQPAEIGEIPVLDEVDKKGYQEIEELWQIAESPKATKEDIVKLRNAYESLREKVIKGDEGAYKVFDALNFNRMVEEITHPNFKMIRFHYPMFSEVLIQQSNEDEFATEVQWRAFVGLYTYMRHRTSENELIPVEKIRQLYKPTTQILKNNPDEEIQRSGNRLMIEIFKYLAPEQKALYIEQASTTFLASSPGTQKISSLLAVNKLYNLDPTLPRWMELLYEARLDLQKMRFQTTADDEEIKKYDIVLMDLLKDPYLINNIEPFSYSRQSSQVQQGVAWALGRIESPTGCSILKTIVETSNSDPIAQEMAIYSIAEHINNPALSNDVLDLINSYASGFIENKEIGVTQKLAENITEAARAMQQKLMDRSLTEPDFYINKLLKTDEEKQKYRAHRDHYIQGSVPLTTLQLNIIDRSLLPYRNFLEKIIIKGGKHQIVPRAITDAAAYKNNIGNRIPDGRFDNDISGASDAVQGTVTAMTEFRKDDFNTFSHEFIHHIQQLILDKDGKPNTVIVDMYQQALQDQRILDNYAQNNEYEFFAQGGEAIDGRYKNHSILYQDLFNNGFDSTNAHIRSWLKRTNKDLYKFLEDLREIPLETSKNMHQKNQKTELALHNNIFKLKNDKKVG